MERLVATQMSSPSRSSQVLPPFQLHQVMMMLNSKMMMPRRQMKMMLKMSRKRAQMWRLRGPQHFMSLREDYLK